MRDTTQEALHAAALQLWLADTDGNDQGSQPYVAASQALASGDTATSIAKRATMWVRNLADFEHFAHTAHRPPRENSRVRADVPRDERRLGTWARYQRLHEQKLTAFQHARLDASPAFVWDINEDAFQRTADRVEAFITRAGRLPYLNVADPVELALGRWLRRQMRHHQNRALALSRSERLTEILVRDTGGTNGC